MIDEISLKQQKEILKDRNGIIKIVSKTICSLTAVINPQTIVIIGTILTNDILKEICDSVDEIIPKKHIPQIQLEHDINKYYLNGLSSMTLEYICCN